MLILFKTFSYSLALSFVFYHRNLSLYLVRPLTIRLEQDVKYLSTNHSYDLRCEVTGSRPAPFISWWKGSVQLRTTREWVSEYCVYRYVNTNLLSNQMSFFICSTAACSSIYVMLCFSLVIFLFVVI